MPKSAEAVAWLENEVVPEDYFTPLDFRAVYGRQAPMEVDLGCGDGSFLVASAASNPEHDFLGIERLAGRVGRACRNIERSRITNARVLRVESSYAVQHLLPPASVTVFHLLFPDPWPKRRHWRRRVVTTDFLSAIYRALIPRGSVRIATDQMDYFQEIERLVAQSDRFAASRDTQVGTPFSTFEKRFRQDDVAIYRLVLRKVSPSRNEVASQ